MPLLLHLQPFLLPQALQVRQGAVRPAQPMAASEEEVVAVVVFLVQAQELPQAVFQPAQRAALAAVQAAPQIDHPA